MCQHQVLVFVYSATASTVYLAYVDRPAYTATVRSRASLLQFGRPQHDDGVASVDVMMWRGYGALRVAVFDV